MWWWIPLARKKFWWWIASLGLPYHNDVFQFPEYFVMRECENIQRLFTSASDSVFRLGLVLGVLLIVRARFYIVRAHFYILV